MTDPRRLLIAAALLASGCSPGSQNNPAASPAPTPSLTSIHVETQGTGSTPTTFTAQAHNRRVYMVKARSSIGDRLADGSFVAVLSRPHVTFYDKDGKTLIGDAPKAVVTERTKTITMSGGVTAHTQDGAVLTCDSMTYSGETERVHGEGHVVLLSAQGDRLSGDTLDGDVRLQHVTIRSAPPGASH